MFNTYNFLVRSTFKEVNGRNRITNLKINNSILVISFQQITGFKSKLVQCHHNLDDFVHSLTAIGAILMVVDENERKIFFEIEFESVVTPKREASIMAAGGFALCNDLYSCRPGTLHYCLFTSSPF